MMSVLLSGCALAKLPGQALETAGKVVSTAGKVVETTGKVVGTAGEVAKSALKTKGADKVLNK